MSELGLGFQKLFWLDLLQIPVERWLGCRGDQSPWVTWGWSWAHLTQRVLPYSLIFWRSSKAMDAFTAWLCLGTCGWVPVASCWVLAQSQAAGTAGKCLLSSTCEMLSILLLFKVIYAASRLPNLLCSSADPIQSPLGTNQPWWHFLHAWRKMSILLWRVTRLKCTARLTIYLVGMTRWDLFEPLLTVARS